MRAQDTRSTPTKARIRRLIAKRAPLVPAHPKEDRQAHLLASLSRVFTHRALRVDGSLVEPAGLYQRTAPWWISLLSDKNIANRK